MTFVAMPAGLTVPLCSGGTMSTDGLTGSYQGFAIMPVGAEPATIFKYAGAGAPTHTFGQNVPFSHKRIPKSTKP